MNQSRCLPYARPILSGKASKMEPDFAGPKIGPYWKRINKRPISLDSFWIGSIWNQLCLNIALKSVSVRLTVFRNKNKITFFNFHCLQYLQNFLKKDTLIYVKFLKMVEKSRISLFRDEIN